MRKIIIIFLFLISVNCFADTYYVAPTGGNNSNPGTEAQPWATLAYGMAAITAGDTLFLRGGTFALTSQLRIEGTSFDDGTYSNPIVVSNYPGETVIIDCDALTHLTGVVLNNKDYWKFIGLNITNAHQDGGVADVSGMTINYANGVHLIQCNFYDNSGPGVIASYCDTVYFTKCDSYYNYDEASTVPGNAADGFQVKSYSASYWSHVYFTKCRAWNNSDDGYGHAGAAGSVMDSCWAIKNGFLYDQTPAYSGRGFNVGQNNWYEPDTAQNIIKHCLSAMNRANGFRNNSNSQLYMARVEYYNNTAAFNGYVGFAGQYGTLNDYNAYYKNNLAYPHPYKTGWLIDAQFSVEPGYPYTSTNNSWDAASSITLSDDDFWSVDTSAFYTIATGARAANGELPDIGFFMKLRPTSDCIDAGVDVGLSYLGSAPDLGFLEYNAYAAPPARPQINTTEPVISWTRKAISGGYITYAGGSPITDKGLVWSTTTDPDLTDNKVECGNDSTIYTGTITGLLPYTTYHVRAYATNAADSTGYGADVVFTTDKWNYLYHNGKIVTHNGKPVIVR